MHVVNLANGLLPLRFMNVFWSIAHVKSKSVTQVNVLGGAVLVFMVFSERENPCTLPNSIVHRFWKSHAYLGKYEL